MTDIITRLRTPAYCPSWADADRVMREAADEIERLQAENRWLLAALAEPAQEPVAWVTPDELARMRQFKYYQHDMPLYAAPQQRPLTDEQIEVLIYEHTKINPNIADDVELLGYIVNAVRAVERAHGIKEAP